MAECMVVDVRTKYGANDGMYLSVWSCEYERRRLWIASAASKHMSRGYTLEPIICNLMKGRKSDNIAN